MTDRIETLRHCRLLEGFTDVGLRILAEVVRERVYPNAQTLQVQGEAPRDPGALVFIASGRVRCEVKDSNGRVLGLGTLTSGEHLGGMRLLGEALSSVTAVAEGDVNALVLDRPAFERLRRQKPQTAMKLIFALSADFGRLLAENQQTFADFAHYAAAQANRSERTYTTYTDLHPLEPTPSIKPGDY